MTESSRLHVGDLFDDNHDSDDGDDFGQDDDDGEDSASLR